MTTRTKRTRGAAKRKKTLTLPLLVRRDMVVFPNQVTQVLVYRNSSMRAVDKALEDDRRIAVVGRRNAGEREYAADDLYDMGVLANVSRTLKMPDGSLNILLEGENRIRIGDVNLEGQIPQAEVSILEEPPASSDEVSALMRAVVTLFGQGCKLSPLLGEEAHVMAMNVDEPGWLADLVTGYLQLPMEERQGVLEILPPLERLHHVHRLLAKEVEVLELQKGIQTEVQDEVEKMQREHLLREQMRVIRRQLGEVDPLSRDTAELREQIQGLGMPEAVQKKALEEVERLEGIPSVSPEVGVVRNYLDWLVNLPWQQETEDTLDTKVAGRVEAGQGADPGVHGRAQAVGGEAAEPHPLLRGAAGGGEDVAGHVHCQGAGPQVCAREPGRDEGRGGDPGAPAHVRGRAAGAGDPDDAVGGDDQPGVHAG